MPDSAIASPAVEQEKVTTSEVVEIRPRQASGSRIYANFRSAISLLRTRSRYGIQAMATVFSAAMVVMVTYILLYPAYSVFNIHLNALLRIVLLASISGISFAVGGLMLLKVLLTVGRERSREFAIRLVVGARRSDVRNQLLFEILLLSVAGGISGNICGLYIGLVLTSLLHLPFSINSVHLLLLISASFVPGIVYGLYAVQRILKQDFAKVLCS